MNGIEQTTLDHLIADAHDAESAAEAVEFILETILMRQAIWATNKAAVIESDDQLARHAWREATSRAMQKRAMELLLDNALPTPDDNEPLVMFAAACQTPLSKFDGDKPLGAYLYPVLRMVSAIVKQRLQAEVIGND